MYLAFFSLLQQPFSVWDILSCATTRSRNMSESHTIYNDMKRLVLQESIVLIDKGAKILCFLVERKWELIRTYVVFEDVLNFGRVFEQCLSHYLLKLLRKLISRTWILFPPLMRLEWIVRTIEHIIALDNESAQGATPRAVCPKDS